MKNILVTGATGLVGSCLITKLPPESCKILGRRKPKGFSDNDFFYADIGPQIDYSSALVDIDVIVHCAALTHTKKNIVPQEYSDINCLGTLNLAQQAVASGVKRFVFISTIKVNGECSLKNKPFRATDEKNAGDNYSQSKSDAEASLLKLADDTGLEVVIIRPPLVYGPGVKGNFASLLKLVSKGVPLPFGCIRKNKRSLVSVDNLVDLILTCIEHPKAANQVFLVSDEHDVSTSEIVCHMAQALGKPIWQVSVPVWCYKLVAKVFGKSEVVDRLTGSLQLDISHTKEMLDWVPPQSLQEGFKQTAEALLQSKKNNGKA